MGYHTRSEASLENLPSACTLSGEAASPLLDTTYDVSLLVLVQPGRHGRPVGQEYQDQRDRGDGQDALDDK
jgi:hypothetical protein